MAFKYGFLVLVCLALFAQKGNGTLLPRVVLYAVFPDSITNLSLPEQMYGGKVYEVDPKIFKSNSNFFSLQTFGGQFFGPGYYPSIPAGYQDGICKITRPSDEVFSCTFHITYPDFANQITISGAVSPASPVNFLAITGGTGEKFQRARGYVQTIATPPKYFLHKDSAAEILNLVFIEI